MLLLQTEVTFTEQLDLKFCLLADIELSELPLVFLERNFAKIFIPHRGCVFKYPQRKAKTTSFFLNFKINSIDL